MCSGTAIALHSVIVVKPDMIVIEKNLIGLVAAVIVTFATLLTAFILYDSNGRPESIVDWSFLLNDDRTAPNTADGTSTFMHSGNAPGGSLVDAGESATPQLADELIITADDFLDAVFDLDALVISGLAGDGQLDNSLVFITPMDQLNAFPSLGAGPFNSVLRLDQALPRGFVGIGQINSGGGGGGGGGGPASPAEEPLNFDLVDTDDQPIGSGTLDLEELTEDTNPGNDEPAPQDDTDNDDPELIALIIDNDVVDSLLGGGACTDMSPEGLGACEEFLIELLGDTGCETLSQAPSALCDGALGQRVSGEPIEGSNSALSSTTAPEPGTLLLLGSSLLLVMGKRQS